MKVVLTVVEGPHAGKSFAFEEHDNFIVGRASCAHFRLPRKDEFFSRVHFMVEVNPPCCRLMDMGSRNGTFVNGQRVQQPVDIHDGDTIQGGNTLIQVAIDGHTPASPASFASSRPTTGARGPTRSAALRTSPPPPGPPAAAPPAAPDGPGSGIASDMATAVPPEPAGSAQWPEATRRVLPADYRERIAGRPQEIPGYLVVDEIGRGGMGIVFLAVCQADGAAVALKTIKPHIAAGAGDLERFFREADILRKLKHPHIVAFREMGEAAGELFFAMDYVPGVDVAKLLRNHGGPLDIPRAVRLVSQLLLALEYAHGQGFVHRDIKPANLLVAGIDGRETVKLADFGLARTYQSSRLSGLTMMGDLGGTVAFMPPEQITNYREARPPADQFAAAATLYFLLTAQCIHDFPAEISQQLLRILQHDAVPLRDRRPEVPDALAAVIHRALDREPEKRFPSAAALRKALAAWSR
ncbi:MAG TPA: FHA domain-containing serine/threonine-protein kinase [Planctomycetaceae bacterium]|nr:FHA domain-containing serine/threonine-protein kinase [Planctomycetaceae bacterium]